MASNVDIIARLQLDASQFSSAGAKAAAEVSSSMTKAAKDIRQPFVSAFAEVKSLAETALQMPRTATGSLDLSAQIASLRQSAAAAENNVLAHREMAAGFLAAANAGHAEAESLRLKADASNVAAIASEREVEALRREASGYEAVQTALVGTTSATRVHAEAGQAIVTSAGAQRAGMQQLGFQLNDIASGFSSGVPPMQIFAQQGSQVVQSLQLMTTKTTGLLGFLGGPWGAVLTAAVVVLAPFVAKLFDAGEAAEAAKVGASGLADAQSVLGNMFDLTSGKLQHQNELLTLNARLTAINLRSEALKDKSSSAKTFDQAGSISAEDRAKAAFYGIRNPFGGAIRGAISGTERGQQNAYNLGNVVADLKAGKTNANDVLRASEKIDFTGLKITKEQFQQAIIDNIASVEKLKIADLVDKSLDEGKLAGPLKRDGKDKKTAAPKKTPDYTRADESTGETIARINAEWTETPSLVKKAAAEHLKLDNIMKDLERRKPSADVEKLKAAALAAGEAIDTGLDRPFQDFLQHQREGVAIQRLELQGRDAEADALQAALRLQDQQGPLDQAHLAALLKGAEQQIAISRQLEDQRRILGLYQNSLSDVRRTFDGFIADLQDGRVADGIKGLFGGLVNDFKALQRNILSEQIFGGLDRDIEAYIRKMTGRQTPAEILSAQATDAAKVLRTGATDQVSALEDLTKAYRAASSAFSGAGTGTVSAANDNAIAPDLLALLQKGNGVVGAPGSLNDLLSKGNGTYGPGPDGAADIVVTGKIDQAATKFLSAADLFSFAGGRLVERAEIIFGKLPAGLEKTLKGSLGTILQGASLGQLGGSVFASITGGKNNTAASSVGGILGDVAGKSLAPAITKAIGGTLGKTLGGAAGPIGAILGGVLGNVLGGLFTKTPTGAAVITSTKTPAVLSGKLGSQLSGDAKTIQSGLQSIADQLGGTIGNFAVSIGKREDYFRVSGSGSSAVGDKHPNTPLLYNGTDEAQAVQIAVLDAIQDGAIRGITAASQKILASGQDLQTALQKALMIEAIPKDLKSMLDPVGAAIDTLNTKFQKTVDALKEGGATAEQMAQAQQLYNLQLDQVKNSTDAADKALRDFQTGLKLGSSSPYSLRDQEATARAALQPFLDQINQGKSIDQGKYQAAAQSFLDVERQLFGSTQGYFTALDQIQAATSKAISTIDNAVPITPGVASPFAQATAESAAATATAVKTGNEMTQDTNALLGQIASLMAQVASNTGGTSSNAFIGTQRLFGTG